MKPVECQFEADVLSAVLQSRWPGRVDSELREHVTHCEICRDVATVAAAMDSAREEIRSDAMVPDSGRVWWLAKLRARREAAETARHAITATQVVALTTAVGLLGACFGATSEWFQSALRSLAGIDVNALAPLLAEHGVLAVGIAVMMLVIPAAVYLAMGRD